MPGILHIVCHCHELQRLVASAMFYVGEPANTGNPNESFSIIMRIVVTERFVNFHGRLEISSATNERIVEPYLIFLDEREHLLVGYGIAITYDGKLLVRFHYPRKKLPEQRKRRIGDYDIGLVAQLPDFITPEITVALEICPLDVFEIHLAVACHVMVENEYLASLVLRSCIVLRSGILKKRAILCGLRRGSITCRN